MPSFIFVRHGQSQGSATGIVASVPDPLTVKGIEQARKRGNELKDKGISLIVSSPLMRARQTAEIIARELGIDAAHIKTIDELRERDLGEVEGKPKEYDSPWYYKDHEQVQGLETRRQLYDRMQIALEKIKVLSRADKVLVVGHGISGYYLLQVAAGKSLEETTMWPSQVINAAYIVVDC